MYALMVIYIYSYRNLESTLIGIFLMIVRYSVSKERILLRMVGWSRMYASSEQSLFPNEE